MTVSSTLLTNQRRHLTTYHNEARAAQGKPLLVQHATLNAMALGWARQMAEKNYFNPNFCHPRPNGYGFFQWWNTKAPAAWRCSSTYCYGPKCPYYIGENIARRYSNASSVFNAWWNSSTHRSNILNRSYRYIGIGIYDARNGDRYWAVQFLGVPTGQ